MSGVADLYNVPLTDDDRTRWSAVHAIHHRDIIAAIYNLTKIALPEFILDPIDPNDTGNWENNHQIMHTQMDPILGISGFDLSQVDWSNQNLIAGWIFLNASEHAQAANTLGIG